MPLFLDEKKIKLTEVVDMMTNALNNNEPTVIKKAVNDFNKIWRFTVLPGEVRKENEGNMPRRLFQLPRSKWFPAFYNITDKEGNTHELRFANKNPRKDKMEKMVWEPEFIEIPESGCLEINKNPELACFCFYHTVNAESGNNETGYHKSMMTYIGSKRALTNVELAEAKYFVNHLIMHPSEGMNREERKVLAKSFIAKKIANNFYDLETMDDNEIKAELIRLGEEDTWRFKEIYWSIDNKFRKMVEKAQGENIVEYNAKDRTWVLNSEDPFTFPQVPLKTDPINWFIEYLITDRKGYDVAIKNMLAAKKEEAKPMKKTA